MNGMDENSGVVDMTNRILQETLKKPALKNSVHTLLKNIDPEASPALARTILFQDVAMLLSLVSALPLAANALIRLEHDIEGFAAGDRVLVLPLSTDLS